MLVEFGVRAFSVSSRARSQALAQFAVVLDLLFDARDLAADAIDLGLHLVQCSVAP